MTIQNKVIDLVIVMYRTKTVPSDRVTILPAHVCVLVRIVRKQVNANPRIRIIQGFFSLILSADVISLQF